MNRSAFLLLLLIGQVISQQFVVSKIANRVAACNVDFGPDGHLYAVNANVPATADRQSQLIRYRLDASGVPTNVQDTLYQWANLTDAVVGMAIDPDSTPEKVLIYISISQDAFIYEWGGRIERLTVTSAGVNREILYYGLPVGFHQINDMVFGPDGKLHIQAGSTTTSGMPGHFSNEWNEKILSAAFLKAEVRSITQPINVQTAGGFSYNPYADDAPMVPWVVSIRNPFDATWHSNGNYYAGTNQNDVNGDTGDCNGQTQNLANQRPDEFLAIIKPGHTYGFPNPSRGECVLMGGNPTAGVDAWEVPDYRVGITPPATFDPTLLFDTAQVGGSSPDGIFEYQSEGALKNRLIQAYYGWDGYIMSYTLGADGRVASTQHLQDNTGADINIRWVLDVCEHPTQGHIYVAAYGDQADNGAAGGLWFLQRSTAVPAADLLRADFSVLNVQTPETVNPTNHTIRIWNAGTTGNALSYTLTSDVPWITIPTATGTTTSAMPTQRKPHQLVFAVGNTAPGTYVGHVNIAATGQTTVTLTVNLVITNNTNIVNVLPQVDAGKNQNIVTSTLPQVVTLVGSATDDGLPNPPGYLTYSWVISDTKNESAVIIDNPHNATTTVTLESYGIYVFQLHVNDGAGISSSLVTVYLDQTGNQKPNITMLKASQYTVHLGTAVQLSVSAVDDGLPTPPGKLSYTWDRVETGVGIATFATPTLPTTMVTFSELSSYLCQCTVSDGVQYLWKQLTIIVVAPNVTITDSSAASTGSDEISATSAPTGSSQSNGASTGLPLPSTDMSCDSSAETQATRSSTQDTPASTTSAPVSVRPSSASSLMVGTLGMMALIAIAL